MKNRKLSLRMLFAGMAFAAVMTFGATQVIATEMDAPGTPRVGCTSKACKTACPEFGGDYRYNGRKWVCYCCG
jgi:hypothetical protein